MSPVTALGCAVALFQIGVAAGILCALLPMLFKQTDSAWGRFGIVSAGLAIALMVGLLLYAEYGISKGEL
jgi:hypothetical protein